MRILQISSARSFGGGERHLVDLTSGLSQRGHDLFVALVPDSPLRAPLSQIDSVKIITLPLRNAADLSSAWKLRKLARENQIEIIHAHAARDYPLAAVAVGSLEAKLVLTRHVLFPLSRVHKLTRRRVARVIAISKAVADNLNAQQIFDRDQITIIRHGIDLNRFQGRKESESGRPVRVGILGEISTVKGQDDFVRAAAILAQQSDNIEFVIAGIDNSSDGRNRKQIEELIAEHELDRRVRLFETLDDVPGFLSSLDVFVSASRSEAFGLAIAEAMASGVPVVATRTPGAEEVIEHDRTGLLVPIGDFTKLAQALGGLLSDSRQREILAENARRDVAEKFSLDRMISETENIYREISGS
ncbi:MAG TPA: glycosyltransferase family 4 protein [Pyrinomonadaceae bacterium]|nr:glycosyltransferase family 4 protein [Pyrinomonadaceae bacterium]